MNAEQLGNLLARIETALNANEERFMEIDARLTAQRAILEQVCANAFIDNPEGFKMFMDDLVTVTRNASTIPEPMSDEARFELTARSATHLTRFGDSVSLLLKQESRKK